MTTINYYPAATGATPTIYSSTLGAAASELTVSGLAGNTDISYRIDFSIIVAATSKCCAIPNGSESNLKAQVMDFVAGARNVTTWRVGNATGAETTFAAGVVLTGVGYLYASTAHGGYRRFSLSVFADAATDDTYYIEGVTTETATEITQFSMQPAAVNGYAANSWLTLTALG